MCDFKLGDEVVRVRMGIGPNPRATTPDVPVGHVGRIINMGPTAYEGVWIELDNWPVDPLCGLPAEHFRRVQRKNTDLSIEAFLTIKPGIEEPRRVRAPKRERVS